VAPGIDGQLGILPHHAPLVTALTIGELVLHKAGRRNDMIIEPSAEGFHGSSAPSSHCPGRSAERRRRSTRRRAEAARRRAETTMAQARAEQEDFIKAEAACAALAPAQSCQAQTGIADPRRIARNRLTGIYSHVYFHQHIGVDLAPSTF